MKRMLSIVLLILMSMYVPKADTELTSVNTVIVSNETDATFCKDFSGFIRHLSLEWVILEDHQLPEPIKDKNLIIIGGPDAVYTSDIVNAILSQEEKDRIRTEKYIIVKKDNPWTENRVVYVLGGSDRLYTKRAAEEGITTIMKTVQDPEHWMYYSFTAWSPEEAEEYVRTILFVPLDEELPTEHLGMDINADPESISTQEARHDVEYLFYLLSHGYSGYGYFKTKGDFDQAKTALLTELETRATWSPEDFSAVIHNHLSFIRDCHFQIGDIWYFNHKNFWHAPVELWKTKGEYFFVFDGTLWNVIQVNGKTPEEFIFPSLNSNGEPVYRLGVLSSHLPEPLTVKAVDVPNGNEKTFEIELYHSYSRFKGIFSEDNVSGIPVISVRSFSDTHTDELEQFVLTGSTYKDEPFLILDIRNNTGGSTHWPLQWIGRFTGELPQGWFISTDLNSKTVMMGQVNMFRQLLETHPDTESYVASLHYAEGQVDLFERTGVPPYWSTYTFPSIQLISNTTTVIVLTDEWTASAGEGFVGYLRQLENVIFVGENSTGCVMSGNVALHQLHHSKLPVRLPSSLFFPVNLEFIEENGFSPDFWVPADDALDYVVAAVKNGTITTQVLPEEPPEELLPEESPEEPSAGYTFVILIATIVLFCFLRKK